jgi:hypothetical protein
VRSPADLDGSSPSGFDARSTAACDATAGVDLTDVDANAGGRAVDGRDAEDDGNETSPRAVRGGSACAAVGERDELSMVAAETRGWERRARLSAGGAPTGSSDGAPGDPSSWGESISAAGRPVGAGVTDEGRPTGARPATDTDETGHRVAGDSARATGGAPAGFTCRGSGGAAAGWRAAEVSCDAAARAAGASGPASTTAFGAEGGAGRATAIVATATAAGGSAVPVAGAPAPKR